MQFSIIAVIATLAATTTASYVPANGTVYPSGTAASTGSQPTSTSNIPFTGGAAMPPRMAGSALGLVVAGGVALML